MIEDAKTTQLEKEVRDMLQKIAAEKDVGEMLVIIYGKPLKENLAHRVILTTATMGEGSKMAVACAFSVLQDVVNNVREPLTWH